MGPVALLDAVKRKTFCTWRESNHVPPLNPQLSILTELFRRSFFRICIPHLAVSFFSSKPFLNANMMVLSGCNTKLLSRHVSNPSLKVLVLMALMDLIC